MYIRAHIFTFVHVDIYVCRDVFGCVHMCSLICGMHVGVPVYIYTSVHIIIYMQKERETKETTETETDTETETGRRASTYIRICILMSHTSIYMYIHMFKYL